MNELLSDEQILQDIDRICGFNEELEGENGFAIERTRHLIFNLVKSQVKSKVNSELERLEGFLGLVELSEDDTNTMLIWVRNAKWALVAPRGQDTATPETEKES